VLKCSRTDCDIRDGFSSAAGEESYELYARELNSIYTELKSKAELLEAGSTK